MRAALVAEYRKLVTTRLWWVLLVVMAGYMAFLAGILAWALSQGAMASGGQDTGPVDLSTESIVRSVYTVTVSLGYVFPLLVGALLVTAEYRHHTLTPTLLAEPSRDRVVAAKLAVGAALGLFFGLVGTAVSTGVGAAVLALLHRPTGLDEGSTWRTLGLSVVALGVWALIGVALGTVITNQVAVIVVGLAFTQFLEPVLRTVLALTSWGKGIGKFLPGSAGEAITGGSLYATGGLAELLSHWWAGLLVLLGYAAVLVVIGRLTTLRRDVT
jgi:ABC-type transport system involved in multi-copper enzyme maturation permease subunit